MRQNLLSIDRRTIYYLTELDFRCPRTTIMGWLCFIKNKSGSGKDISYSIHNNFYLFDDNSIRFDFFRNLLTIKI